MPPKDKSYSAKSANRVQDKDRIPVSILTGFLGSGKTTLLNRILTENHGLKIAVIENEFGEIGIDNELVVNSGEEVVEMNNGCICCTVRGDLIRILTNLVEEKKHKFDRILIETTGLADPAPVAQTFFVDEKLAKKFYLDGIITVVDVKHIDEHWGNKETQEQIAFADVLLLNKLDLLDLPEQPKKAVPVSAPAAHGTPAAASSSDAAASKPAAAAANTPTEAKTGTEAKASTDASDSKSSSSNNTTKSDPKNASSQKQDKKADAKQATKPVEHYNEKEAIQGLSATALARLQKLQTKIAGMNPTATVFRTRQCLNVPVHTLLDIGGFNVRRALVVDPEFMKPEAPHEWAGVYVLPKSSPQIKIAMSVAKGPDASMNIVVLPINEAPASSPASSSSSSSSSSSTAAPTSLAELKSKANKQAATEKSTNKKGGTITFTEKQKQQIEIWKSLSPEEKAELTSDVVMATVQEAPAALQPLERPAAIIFSDRKNMVVVPNKGSLSPGNTLYQLNLEEGDSEYYLNVSQPGKYAVFTEHNAAEEYSFKMSVISTVDGKEARQPAEEQISYAYKQGHEHDNSISSVGITVPGDVDMDKINEWIGTLLREKGESIYRMKGVLSIQGMRNRFVFQGVHMLFSGQPDRLWLTGERHNALIFIGRNLNRQELTQSFLACLAK